MEDLNKINQEEYHNNHKFLAEPLLVPNANKTDSNRLQMFTSHISQCIPLQGAEPPLVFTNFEDQVGKHSTGYKMLEGNYKIIEKIVKNKFNYDLVILNQDTGEYDMVSRHEHHWLTEHYGYKFNNEVIDGLKKGQEISGKTVLYKNNNYDEEMNFQYGVNLNAIYLAYDNKTYEDAIPISESAGKKLCSHSVKKVMISVNTNDILVNVYGDEDNYKCFPDIGEEIDEQIILSRRRINYEKLLFELKNLSEIRESDDTFYSSGQIVDINIYNNQSLEVLEDQDYSKQILKYIRKQNEYYKGIVRALKNIVEGKEENKISQNLLYNYNRAKMILDEGNTFTYQNNKFDNYIIEFSILEDEPVKEGSKLTGRYGNKGIISEKGSNEGSEYQELKFKVLPDIEMPVIAEGPFKGQRAEIVLNPLGVYNRMNPSQMIEMEINFVSKYIRKKMEEDLDNAVEILLDYVGMINKEQAQHLEEYLTHASDEEFQEAMMGFINNGIPIHQGSFWNNIGIDEFREIYKKYDFVKEFKFEGIHNPIIMGEMYIMRLKHEAINKFSARSTGFNDLKDLPSKGKAYKEYKDIQSRTPIRFGSMEVTNAALVGDGIDPIKILMDSYSTNIEDRTALTEEMVTGNPFDIQFTPTQTESNNSKIIRGLFTSLGLELDKGEDEEK